MWLNNLPLIKICPQNARYVWTLLWRSRLILYCMRITCQCTYPANMYHGRCISRHIQFSRSHGLDATCPLCRCVIDNKWMLFSQAWWLDSINKFTQYDLYQISQERLLPLGRQLKNIVFFHTIDHEVVDLT